MKAQGFPKRGPRATYDERLSSWIAFMQGKGTNRHFLYPEKGRTRRKREEQRQRVRS